MSTAAAFSSGKCFCWSARIAGSRISGGERTCGKQLGTKATSVAAAKTRWFWCKHAAIGDDGRMQPFVPVEVLFKGRHFDGQIIILCVTWYTSFKLSLRDLVIMMADRGIRVTHTQRFCAGSSIICRNSRSAGADTLGRSADPGGRTRHI